MNGTETNTYYDNSSGTTVNETGTVNTSPIVTSAITSPSNTGNVAGSATGSSAWIWIILLIIVAIGIFYFFSKK